MERIMILYHSGRGTTRKMSEKLKDLFTKKLDNPTVDVVNIEGFSDYNRIKESDFLVFAFPVYDGLPSKTFREFLGRLNILLDKRPVALFANCRSLPGNSLRQTAGKLKSKNYYTVSNTYIKASAIKSKDSNSDKGYFSSFRNFIDSTWEKKIENAVDAIAKQIKKATYTYQKPKMRYDALLTLPFGETIPFPKREVIFQKERCSQCGKCIEVCPRGSYKEVADGYPLIDRSRCEDCLRCIVECPGKALKEKKHVPVSF